MTHPLTAFREVSGPVDVPEHLHMLEQQLVQMEASGASAQDRFRLEVAGLAGVAGAVHVYEVVQPRDKLWKEIAGVVRRTEPFSVEYGSTDAISMSWNFHDGRYPITEQLDYGQYPENSKYADVAISSRIMSYSAGHEAVSGVRQAFQYAYGEKPASSRNNCFAALLGIAPERVGQPGQFDGRALLACAVEKFVDTVDALDASLHGCYNYDNDVYVNRNTLGSNTRLWLPREDYGYNGVDRIAGWFDFQQPANLAHLDVEQEMREELPAGTVHDKYAYFDTAYIEPGRKTVAQFQEVHDWLQQPSVVAVTSHYVI